jgi:hypothetical protein
LFPDQYQHPNPALPGELRWYAQAEDEEKEHEVALAELAWYVDFGDHYQRVETMIWYRTASTVLHRSAGMRKTGNSSRQSRARSSRRA